MRSCLASTDEPGAAPIGRSEFVRASGRWCAERRFVRNAAMITQVKDRQLLTQVVRDLEGFGIVPLVFGGWSMELLGLEPARDHTDIDLLVTAPTQVVDAFIASRTEVIEKRFSHKRSFVEAGVLVELFLVNPADGSTRFWDEAAVIWPSLQAVVIADLPVAPAETVFHYAKHYDAVHAARP